MAHVAQWKKEEVQDLKELISGSSVVGIANLSDIPARQLQKMRENLRDKATIRMSKKNLINLALDDSNMDKAEINNLSNYMDGQPALILTNMNPFKLFKILEDSKTPAPAKAGAIPSEDIIVPEGDTGFPPGPFLGELQQAGIPAKIDKGSIVVQNDQMVVKAGEEVSPKVASILTRLDIQPLEVGIDLKAAYENETVYTADLLTIDADKTLSDVQKAFAQAFNLSVNAVIYTKKSMPSIMQNTANKALNLAFNASILTSKTTGMLIAKGYTQMLALASAVSTDPQALDSELLEKLASSESQEKVVEVKKEKKPDDDDEESEKEQEEDAAAGLGALFG